MFCQKHTPPPPPYFYFTRVVRKVMPSTVSFLTKMSYLIAPSVIQSVQRSAFQRVQDELAICFQSKVISERMEVISCAKFKQRAVIEFLVAEGCEPIEIHRRLLNVFGNETVDVSTVRRWVLRAKNSDRGKLIIVMPIEVAVL